MSKQWHVTSSVTLKRYTRRTVRQTTGYLMSFQEHASEQAVVRAGKVLVTIDLDHILAYYAAVALRNKSKKATALDGWIIAKVVEAKDEAGPVQEIPLRDGYELVVKKAA